jgi:hypothetical protein
MIIDGERYIATWTLYFLCVGGMFMQSQTEGKASIDRR